MSPSIPVAHLTARDGGNADIAGSIYRPCAAAATGILPHAALAHLTAKDGGNADIAGSIYRPCAAAATGILPHAALALPCAAGMSILLGAFTGLRHIES